MTEQVDFYILASANQGEKLKIACRVAQKAFSQGLKVYLHTQGAEQSGDLDKLLWTFAQNSFVPHAQSGQDIDWDDYPVQIGETEPAAEVDVLISLSGEVPQQHQRFPRIVDLITEQPDDKKAGRQRYRFYRDAGLQPNTHNIT